MSKLSDLKILEAALPSSIAEDESVRSAVKGLDPELAALIPEIRALSTIMRPMEAPGDILPHLAWGMHVDLWRDEYPEDVKRRLIAESIPWHRIKGTPRAVLDLLSWTGVEAEIIEWFSPSGVAAGMAPYTFALRGKIVRPLSRSVSWGVETADEVAWAVSVAKNARSWLAWLSLALEIDIAMPRWSATCSERAVDTVRTHFDLFPRFDFLAADADVLDPGGLLVKEVARDCGAARFVLGRLWTLDAMFPEGVRAPEMDLFIEGAEGEREPSVRSGFSASKLSTEAGMSARLDVARRRSHAIRCALSTVLATHGAIVVESEWGADCAGLDTEPGFDDVGIDVVGLDTTLEVTHV